jgi:uncharacterized SAM-binding protein YcdF (DUF218 family)
LGFVLVAAGWRAALQRAGAFLVVDDALRPADAVVVLSGDASRSRLDEAIRVVRLGAADRVIALTATPPDFYEATAIRRYVERRGVDPGRVVVAGEAHSTLDEARLAAQVMRERGWRSAIVVTSPYHTRRARWVFYRCMRPLTRGSIRTAGGRTTAAPRRWCWSTSSWPFTGSGWG